MQEIEEKIAHLIRAVDDLSDIAHRQGQEIDVLTRRVAMLVQREAEREANSVDAEVVADRPPPHY